MNQENKVNQEVTRAQKIYETMFSSFAATPLSDLRLRVRTVARAYASLQEHRDQMVEVIGILNETLRDCATTFNKMGMTGEERLILDILEKSEMILKGGSVEQEEGH